MKNINWQGLLKKGGIIFSIAAAICTIGDNTFDLKEMLDQKKKDKETSEEEA